MPDPLLLAKETAQAQALNWELSSYREFMARNRAHLRLRDELGLSNTQCVKAIVLADGRPVPDAPSVEAAEDIMRATVEDRWIERARIILAEERAR